jgi:hypothetical protein
MNSGDEPFSLDFNRVVFEMPEADVRVLKFDQQRYIENNCSEAS